MSYNGEDMIGDSGFGTLEHALQTPVWIFADIDGDGKKWRLAVYKYALSIDESNPEPAMWYFPIEDLEDYQENYLDCKQVPCLRPDEIG